MRRGGGSLFPPLEREIRSEEEGRRGALSTACNEDTQSSQGPFLPSPSSGGCSTPIPIRKQWGHLCVVGPLPSAAPLGSRHPDRLGSGRYSGSRFLGRPACLPGCSAGGGPGWGKWGSQGSRIQILCLAGLFLLPTHPPSPSEKLPSCSLPVSSRKRISRERLQSHSLR